MHSERSCAELWAKLNPPPPGQYLVSQPQRVTLAPPARLRVGTVVIWMGLLSSGLRSIFSPGEPPQGCSPGCRPRGSARASWKQATALLCKKPSPALGFLLQRQQDTLMWPRQCSLSMQLAGKAITRVQIVNLPYRAGFWVHSPVLKFFWLSRSKAECCIRADLLIHMGCDFKRKHLPLPHLPNLPLSPRKTNMSKDRAVSKGFLSSCRKKVSFKETYKPNETWDNSDWENKANPTTDQVMLPSTFYLAGWGNALQVGFHLLGIAVPSLRTAGDLGYERKVSSFVLCAWKCLLLT